jgi:hypothetical protein
MYKNALTRSRLPITSISCPIDIGILNIISVTSIGENKFFSKCSFDVLKNSNNCVPITVTRRVKELTYEINVHIQILYFNEINVVLFDIQIVYFNEINVCTFCFADNKVATFFVLSICA